LQVHVERCNIIDIDVHEISRTIPARIAPKLKEYAWTDREQSDVSSASFHEFPCFPHALEMKRDANQPHLFPDLDHLEVGLLGKHVRFHAHDINLV
jgi:hypothetical protein